MERSKVLGQSFLQKIQSKIPIVLLDVALIPIAWFVACGFQFDVYPYFEEWKPLLTFGVVQVSAYYFLKVYRGMWRYTSMADLSRIIQSVGAATLVSMVAFHFLGWFDVLFPSLLILNAVLLSSLLCLGRFCVRAVYDRYYRKLDAEKTIQRVIIIGAGSSGSRLIKEMKGRKSYQLVGVVDDSKKKRGLEVHGVRVVGTIAQLPELVLQTHANLAVIAIPSLGSADMRRVVNQCESAHITFRTLPSIADVTSGNIEINMIKPVRIEDLLGRDQVELDWDKITQGIGNRRVVVTGAGGSIGSELCRQIAQLNPQKLLLLDNSEPNLYHIDYELKQAFPEMHCETALVSVVDKTAINTIFHSFKPEIVFHAAAYKHVPLLEHQVRIAVRNNVLGTTVTAEASADVGAEKFVLISTDKAVNPTNVMGTTKRIAEIFCQNMNARVGTEFITVRFGNVLGSVGSVVPLFQKQLKAGGPLTVTHPDIQRYFMTIPESCQLILQAMVNGSGGEIFVLDMGEPIKITYLAEQMIRLSGKIPGVDIKIQFTGLRPGEKLFEELFHPSEELTQTAHEKLFQARFRSFDWDELNQTIHMVHSACDAHENEELLILLKSLVPEFRSAVEHRPSLSTKSSHTEEVIEESL